MRSGGPGGSWSMWTPDVKWFVPVLCRDISYTALSALPDHILSGLKKLIAESAFQLKELPPPELFGHLQQANLTYPSHCCAFHNLRRNRSLFPPLSTSGPAQNRDNATHLLSQVQVEPLVLGAERSGEPSLLPGLLHQLQLHQLQPRPGRLQPL